MVMALLLFLCGWKLYKVQSPSKENIAREVAGCIFTAASRSIFELVLIKLLDLYKSRSTVYNITL